MVEVLKERAKCLVQSPCQGAQPQAGGYHYGRVGGNLNLTGRAAKLLPPHPPWGVTVIQKLPPRSGPLPLPLASRSAGAAGPPAQGKKTQSVPRAPLGQTQRPRPVDETGSCVWRSGLNMQVSSLMRRIFRAPQEERRSRRGNAPRLRRAASGGLVKIYTFCVFGLVPWAMVW